jgi:hypothetical protein
MSFMHSQSNAPPGTVTVPLANRQRRALIDVADAALVVQYRWFLAHGYAYTAVRDGGRQVNIRMHRMLMGLANGDPREVDHINRDRLDNRRCNLRLATSQQNDQNRPAIGGSSRYRGVCHNPRTGSWRAIVAVNGKQVNCGSYRDEMEAARAAEAGRRAHHPFAVPIVELEPVPPCPCKACSPNRLPGMPANFHKAA